MDKFESICDSRNCERWNRTSRALAADATRKLQVLGKESDTLCVDGTQVGVLKELHQVFLRCLLQRENGTGLEAKIMRPVNLRNFPNETAERDLSEQEVGGLLVFADLAERQRSRTVAVGLLDVLAHAFASDFGELVRCRLSTERFGSLLADVELLASGVLAARHNRVEVGSKISTGFYVPF